jgi:hypothetical protein
MPVPSALDGWSGTLKYDHHTDRRDRVSIKWETAVIQGMKPDEEKIALSGSLAT